MLINKDGKRTISSSDAWRLVAWLSQVHPDIFKEFTAVLDVYERANEPDGVIVDEVQTDIYGRVIGVK